MARTQATNPKPNPKPKPRLNPNPNAKNPATDNAVVATAAQRLNREAWLDAAYEAVAEQGFGGLRVLTLSKALGVTRGSFYWHFADHAALLWALLDRWQAQELLLCNDALNQPLEDPVDDLKAVLAAALAHAGEDYKYSRFELAIRGLGRRDAKVGNLLAAVDANRMAMFETKFVRLGKKTKEAKELAAMFYLTIIGSTQAIGTSTAGSQFKPYLMKLITAYLITNK